MINKSNAKYIIINLFLFLLIICYTSGCTVSDSNSKSDTVSYKCENQNVTSTVLNIFKNNNNIYNSIEPTTISNIEFINPLPTAFDESIEKYSCKATIEVTSNAGFTPDLTKINKELCIQFLNRSDDWNTVKSCFNRKGNEYFGVSELISFVDCEYRNACYFKYNRYKYLIEYTAQKSPDGVYVEADVNNRANISFSCYGQCELGIITPDDILINIYGSKDYAKQNVTNHHNSQEEQTTHNISDDEFNSLKKRLQMESKIRR